MKKHEQDFPFTLVTTEGELNKFYTENTHAGWLAFDTEFIPEKYYKYKLCIISVATARGNYIIDALKLKNISPFIKLIENPSIVKITHAGENDYQLLVIDHNAKPQNVFDTQLANGFLQFDYPMGLQPLLQKALRVKLNKGALRSDWEIRPLSPDQCQYAVQDVVYLHPLMVALKRRLKKNGKLEWAMEENKRLENPEFYRNDPLDFLNNAQVNQFSSKQKVFLMRMHMWRHLEAEKENRPLTQVMKTGVLNTIVQKIEAGESALLKDRTLPARFIRENLDTFRRLYEDKISIHEKELLDQTPEVSTTTSRASLLVDMLHQLIKYKGLKRGVSPKLIVSSKELQVMRTDSKYIPQGFKDGWRKKMLGKELLKLLENRDDFYITIKKNKFILRVKPRGITFLQNLFNKIKGLHSVKEEEETADTPKE
ncbi:MAG TPA: hypothetical protein VK469_12685 [Candidatus Kapabacteria bacterium]|nr:hypothetical protein [Candidatus Kapabacteria bacterium]